MRRLALVPIARRLALVTALTALVMLPAVARAGGNTVELYFQGNGGYGNGSGEEETTVLAGNVEGPKQGFYDLVGGPGLGAEVGLKFVFLDVHADFLRFVGSHPGTLLRGLVGLRADFGDDVDFYIRLGVGGMAGFFGDSAVNGFEVGKTPLGFTARAGLGVLWKFGGVFSVGPVADVGYYRLLNGTVMAEPTPEQADAIQAACGDPVQTAEYQACVEEQVGSQQVGAGYETSSGIDFSAMLALRVTLGF